MRKYSAIGLVLLVTLSPAALAAPERGTIEGKVQTEHGKDFSGVAVKARAQQSGEISTAFTDSDGNFSLSLDPGEYSLSFDAPGYQTAVLQITYGVTAGETTRVKTVQMVKDQVYSLIKGAVFTEEGLSLPGARVVIERLDDSGKPLKEGRDQKITNSAGSFAFRLPFASARYRITASLKGFTDDSKELAIEKGESRSIAFRLSRAVK